MRLFDMKNTLARAPSQDKNQVISVLIRSCLLKAGGSSGARPAPVDRVNLVVPAAWAVSGRWWVT